jgi:hypothetical protein
MYHYGAGVIREENRGVLFAFFFGHDSELKFRLLFAEVGYDFLGLFLGKGVTEDGWCSRPGIRNDDLIGQHLIFRLRMNCGQ